MPPLPTPREHLAAAALGDVVYVAGGRVGSLESNLPALEAFDTGSLTWEELPDMPTARGGIAAATFEGRIHVLGGESPTRTFDRNEAFDPELRRWLPMAPLPTPRHGLGAAVVADRLYTVAGGTEPGFSLSSAVEALLPQEREDIQPVGAPSAGD
jgi:hypothetical protein